MPARLAAASAITRAQRRFDRRPDPPRGSCGGRASARPCRARRWCWCRRRCVPTLRYGWVMPATFERDAAIDLVLRIERVQDRGRALQRVDAGRRDRGMRHLAVHRHLHLQAAVVGGDDLVAEAGGDQQVGLGQARLQQPAGAELAAEFLVVGEVQLDAAAPARRRATRARARRRCRSRNRSCSPPRRGRRGGRRRPRRRRDRASSLRRAAPRRRAR